MRPIRLIGPILPILVSHRDMNVEPNLHERDPHKQPARDSADGCYNKECNHTGTESISIKCIACDSASFSAL